MCERDGATKNLVENQAEELLGIETEEEEEEEEGRRGNAGVWDGIVLAARGRWGSVRYRYSVL